MKIISRLSSFLFILNVFSISGTYGKQCDCYCDVYGGPGRNVCELLRMLNQVTYINSQKLQDWQEYEPFVEYFSSRWREEIANIVETKIDEYISAGKLHPKPEALVMEEGMQNDFSVVPNSSKVDDLLAKVEMVENKTLEVEQELKSERRVRRHLEQEVNKTQSSLISLSDQLQIVTDPVDAKMNQVEIVLTSALDNMNKTIHEDHLKKLYYKVDGVVYKNETKKLDERLEQVEIELLSTDNSSIVSKLEEGFKDLEKSLYFLNNSVEEIVPRVEAIKDLAGDVLIPRIETLETETVRRNETDDLETKITSLLKDTEMMRIELANVSSNILDFQNLKTDFEVLSEQWDISLKMLHNQIELLKNESLLRPPVQQIDDTNEIVQQNELGNTLDDEIPNSEDYEDLNVVSSFLTNVSRPPENDSTRQVDHNSTQEIEISSEGNGTRMQETSPSNYEEYLTLEPQVARNDTGSTAVEFYIAEHDEAISTTEATPNRGSREEIEEFEEALSRCGKPDIEDDHLLVDVVEDSHGKKQLKFGCRPIGLYAVSYPPIPPRCGEETWKGPFPTCIKLAEMTEIDALGEEMGGKISCPSIIFPDPTNCSQFFKCDNGRAYLFSCPSNLHFNAQLKVCDYPRLASCTPVKSVYDEKLATFIPPIYIEPDNIDRPSSHLGTGSAGQLIVHPRSSFTLHCLYPESSRGYPKWNVTYASGGQIRSNSNTNEGRNRVSVIVKAATEENSGIYTCVTPFGVEHAIEVIVKVVVCPTFNLTEEYEDVYYRLTPEGEQRIMGTRAEFQCEAGHRVFRQCMANGTWSGNGLPSEKECRLKKRTSDDMWNCKSLDLSDHPDLIPERNNSERKVVFKCAGGKKLIGYSYMRCKNDGHWSQTSLPMCK